MRPVRRGCADCRRAGPGVNDPAVTPVEAGKHLVTRRRYGIVASLFATVLVLDQISKAWVLSVISAAKPSIELTAFLNIVLVWNRGISFGVLNRDSAWQPWLLSGVAILIVTGLLIWVRKVETGMLVVAIGLVSGGAIGNVVDRIRHGAVVDFVDFHVGGWHFATFNVADAAIVTGVALMLFDSLFGGGKTAK